MSETTQTVALQYIAETAGLRREISQLTKTIVNQSNKAKDGFEKQEQAASGLGETMMHINQAWELMGRVTQATVGQLVRVTQAAMAQEQTLAGLATSMERTGIGYRENEAAMQSFAAELQRTAGIADTETQETMQRIAALGRGVITEYAALQDATEFVMNASAETGESLEALGERAVQVATGQLEGLREKFPQLTQELQAMQAAGASGSEMLAHMADEMRGVAADGDQATIQIARVGLAFGDVQEAIGGIILGTIRSSTVVGDLASTFDDLAVAIADPTSRAGVFAREALGMIVGAGQLAANVVARLGLGFMLLKESIDVAIAGAQAAIAEIESWDNSAARSAARQARASEDIRSARAAVAGVEAEIERIRERDRVETEFTRRQIRQQENRLRVHREAETRAQAEFDEVDARVRQQEASWVSAQRQAEEASRAFADARNEFETMAMTGDQAIGDMNAYFDRLQEAIPDAAGAELGADGAGDVGRFRQPGDGGDDPADDEKARLGLIAQFEREKSAAQAERVAGPFVEGLGLMFTGVQDVNAALGEGIVALVEYMDQMVTFGEVSEDIFKDAFAGLGEDVLGLTEDLGAFLATGESKFESFGDAIKKTLGSTFGQIGGAFRQAAMQQALTAGFGGPFAAFAGIGALFGLVSGLLSGGGRSGDGSSVGEIETVSDVMQTMRSDFSMGGGTSINYNLTTGPIFSRDESRQTVATLFREARNSGDLRSSDVGG